ncbi:MAG: MGH1-like glycoside hydrolase domain-containing protein [bacterium]
MGNSIRGAVLRGTVRSWQALTLRLMFQSSCLLALPQLSERSAVAVSFDGKFGQIEIGGKYVGAEFHHSLPLPSRLSFYSPVANSIDLSTDYWHRDESMPFSVIVSIDGKSDTVGRVPFAYTWTPFHAVFTRSDASSKLEFSYHFCEDLLFLHALTAADSVLPHAYYWRDDGFKTELCASDNWNHLWFIILASSYLKHSGDRETLTLLYPMLEKSLRLMLQNKGAGDLMYASRPDWWDIGKIYGARAYITTLMIRALRAFSAIALELNVPEERLREHVRLAQSMQGSLTKNLWDQDAGYILNMLDGSKLDRHYYAGSLLAAACDLLDEQKRDILLETARRELLDRGLGIRNAMPADFHRLIDIYGFNGMEAGEPYVYINGGVWSQGIAWYALGLLAAGKPDSARDTLTNYLTLAGIRNSPGGQPALFEYRNADPDSPHYGQIDKPTFLWAAGWYLFTLYHLAGLRENEWNVSFDPHLPNGFEDIVYDLQLGGKSCEVSCRGTGEYFKRILVDGKNTNSAVVLASPAKILLERGRPDSPYLAYSSASVSQVEYDGAKHALTVQSAGVRGQSIVLRTVTLSSPRRLVINGVDQSRLLARAQDGEVWVATCQFIQTKPQSTLVFEF